MRAQPLTTGVENYVKNDKTKWYALANEEEIKEMTKCKSNMFEEDCYQQDPWQN